MSEENKIEKVHVYKKHITVRTSGKVILPEGGRVYPSIINDTTEWVWIPEQVFELMFSPLDKVLPSEVEKALDAVMHRVPSWMKYPESHMTDSVDDGSLKEFTDKVKESRARVTKLIKNNSRVGVRGELQHPMEDSDPIDKIEKSQLHTSNPILGVSGDFHIPDGPNGPAMTELREHTPSFLDGMSKFPIITHHKPYSDTIKCDGVDMAELKQQVKEYADKIIAGNNDTELHAKFIEALDKVVERKFPRILSITPYVGSSRISTDLSNGVENEDPTPSPLLDEMEKLFTNSKHK